jgi:flagella basal body P-ring formation protein FlgA
MTVSHLKKTYLVPKGSTITVIAQRGHLRIETKGKARESGEKGQLIRVMNLSSKKEVIGEVIGDKQVRIHF